VRARGAAIQGGLAAAGLLLAYATWQREPERAPGEVVVLEAGKNDLTQVRYDDGAGRRVELSARPGSDGESEIWMHLSARDGKPPVPERELRGNEGSRRLFERFAPLRATRALGTLAGDKLKELGLDAPKKKIAVTARGAQTTLDVGMSPYGVSEPYVKDERDGRVYVLGAGVISELDGAASRLVDRTLHSFKPAEYDAVTLTVGAKKRELAAITPPGGVGPVKLAAAKTRDKPDELASNWHDKLWRAMVTEVLGKGETPAGGAPTVALRVDYLQRGKPRGFIEVGRVAAPAPAATSTAPPPADVYARSEHTAGWVKLPPTTEDVLKEADKVAAGE
jgi:hypothetical protein